MRALAVAGSGVVVLVEALVLLLGHAVLLLPVAGASAALVLLVLRQHLGEREDPSPALTPEEGRRESLQRWKARTENLISWSEGTRGDWDRHLRPVLAREFARATRGRPNSREQSAIGTMLFGPNLWPWVDPNLVSTADDASPAPGRAVLAEILDRLEQL